MNKTINQWIDIFITKYNSFQVMSNPDLAKLYNKLMEAKLKYGGRQVIEPKKECEELINKYLL